MSTYKWRLSDAMFNSFARASQNVVLSVDYSTGVDTSWPDKAIMGPELTTVDLSGVAGTTASTCFGVRGVTSSSEEVIYFLRGTKPAKVALATAAVDTASGVTCAAAAISAVTITTPAGAQQIALSMAASAYRVITTCATLTNADTSSVNTGSNIRSILGAEPQSVVGLGSGQQVYRNFISGSVTMNAPSWNSINSLNPIPFPVTFTSFTTLSTNQFLIGTTKGPLIAQLQFGRLGLLSDRIPESVDNCRAAAYVEWLGGGVVVPLEGQTRLITPGGGQRVGPEDFEDQTSPVQGMVMGADYDQDWYVCSYLNRFTGTYYILKAKPNRGGTWHDRTLNWYCIGTTTSAVKMVKWTGTDGGRTLPTWWLGKDSDVMYFGAGRTKQWPDDTSYTYTTTTQSLYLTELRFDEPHRLTRIALETKGCSANARSVSVYWTVDNGTEVKLQSFDRDGRHFFDVPETLALEGMRHKPRLEFANNNASASPYTVGQLVCEIDPVPERPEAWQQPTSVLGRPGW